jgi:hypothetical protein
MEETYKEYARSIWRDYNILPDVLEAEKQFRDQERAFAAAQAVLANYPEGFGICLIHGHGALDHGEILLASGDVSEPTKISETLDFYPERWLASGKPYEFTTRPTKMPSPALLEGFKTAMRGNTSLGLCYPMLEDGEVSPKPRMEWTEGRRILTRLRKDGEVVDAQIPTSWTLQGEGLSAAWYCNVWCPPKTTKSGSGHSERELLIYALLRRRT